MFYRRKVILALIQSFGGSLGKTQLQKLLLLYTQKQEKPDYHFVPYKFGCYSFQAASDISTMQKYGQVQVSNKGIEKADPVDYVSLLKEKDRMALKQLYILHGNKDYKDLIHHTYTQHPYYAIHSERAERYLNAGELQKVAQYRPTASKTILYTIGYEGISLEQYLNKLIGKAVRVLVDVRNNPQSMKYGFTKSQLLNACTSVGIEYLHLPEVGIISEQRQELTCQADYDKLFAKYRKETLPYTVSTQEKILHLLKEKKRIALTCFEANICQCHRKHLAEAIIQLPGWDYELIHL
ncbi:DUF488 domain-containing protein [Flavihumibacter cheonanensis]|uniref:DUF488 domain-containing protein n=1 Tax=Flavihumibacter cheonanensis TaxID=1442385 RepID=UPI001EF76959|nr:DUF488 domain-containing protein [Flavihumibacter cheonanensis]MCG7754459.1 DUF488 domain-containing protein [Flavihumibacter cheonanensis]